MESSKSSSTGLTALRFMREKIDLTQSQLGRMIGATDGTVGRYEIGLRSPSVHTLRKLAAALNCTVADLLTEPKPALIPAEELAQAEAELVDLEARIARLKAEVGRD